ncbi:MAG: hypothetical protein AB1689_20825 [Thermodesulfobacteriota bacterium]
MTKLAIPLAAALLMIVSPVRADDSETHVEETYEERDGLDARSAQRSVEIEREDDDESRTIEREESIESDDGEVERHVEEEVTEED